MRRQPVFYPFLFLLFAILVPLTSNLDQFRPVLALRSLGVFLLLGAGLWLVLRLIFKNEGYAGYLTFLVLAWFFSFGHIDRSLNSLLPAGPAQYSSWIVLALLTAAVLLLARPRTWRRLGGAARLTPFLNLVLAAAVVSQGLTAGWYWFQKIPRPSAAASGQDSLPDTGSEPVLDCALSPDIYWIVLDGYGRADVLEELYGVDTTGFLDSLRARGFTVAAESYTNYMQTVYSIPSALEMDYLAPMPASANGYDYFPELIANNRLMRLLRHCSYRMVSFETGFSFTNVPSADTYLTYENKHWGPDLNEYESLLLDSTSLGLLLEKLEAGPPKRSYTAHRGRVLDTFTRLAELPGWAGPKFVFAHILTPHPPFVFAEDGSPIQPTRRYSLADGDHYRGSWSEYRAGYAGQVQNANRLLEQTLDAILKRSARPPVIIIQGDHGPGGHLEWKSPQESCLWERTAILNAYYLPETPAGAVPAVDPGITPVNSFRLVLNTYFGTDLEYLPSAAYFTSPTPGGDFFDITAQRESRENCPQGGAR